MYIIKDKSCVLFKRRLKIPKRESKLTAWCMIPKRTNSPQSDVSSVNTFTP